MMTRLTLCYKCAVVKAGDAPVFQHELQGLPIQVARQVKLVDHVQLVFAHVYKVLQQLESPHMLSVESPPFPVLARPEVLLPFSGRHGAICTYRRLIRHPNMPQHHALLKEDKTLHPSHTPTWAASVSVILVSCQKGIMGCHLKHQAMPPPLW